MTRGSIQLAGQACRSMSLAGYSLTAYRGEPGQALAWANAIGLAFLVVGAVGLLAPQPEGAPRRSVLQPVVEVEEWRVATGIGEAAGGESIPEIVPESEELPDVVRVLWEAPGVVFAVPTVGPVEVAVSLALAPALGPLPVLAEPVTNRVLSLRLSGRGGNYPQPDYPFRFLQARMQGEIVLRILVDDAGGIGAVTVVKSTGYAALDRHTVEHVRRRFTFPSRGGERVYELPVVYQIP